MAVYDLSVFLMLSLSKHEEGADTASETSPP